MDMGPFFLSLILYLTLDNQFQQAPSSLIDCPIWSDMLVPKCLVEKTIE